MQQGREKRRKIRKSQTARCTSFTKTNSTRQLNTDDENVLKSEHETLSNAPKTHTPEAGLQTDEHPTPSAGPRAAHGVATSRSRWKIGRRTFQASLTLR